MQLLFGRSLLRVVLYPRNYGSAKDQEGGHIPDGHCGTGLAVRVMGSGLPAQLVWCCAVFPVPVIAILNSKKSERCRAVPTLARVAIHLSTALAVGGGNPAGLPVCFDFTTPVAPVQAFARPRTAVLASAQSRGLDSCAAAWGSVLGQSRPRSRWSSS